MTLELVGDHIDSVDTAMAGRNVFFDGGHRK